MDPDGTPLSSNSPLVCDRPDHYQGVVVFEEGRSSVVPGNSIEFGLVPEGLRYFASDTGRAL
jgi:hypothetical protein